MSRGPRLRMALHPEEPPPSAWRVVPLSLVLDTVRQCARPVAGRPFVLAIDGRSSGGKTTLSRQIVDTAPGTAVVHTDDIAWYHSMFGRADLAVELLVPVRRGEPIAYRTPAWDAHGRPGAIVVPAGSPLLVLEGVGSSRCEVAHLVDASMWVQSDLTQAE